MSSLPDQAPDGYFRDGKIDSGWLRSMCLEAGADDVGFASIDDPALGIEREYALDILPRTQTLIGLCVRMSRENIRSPARSAGNAEYFHTGDEISDAARHITRRLEDEGFHTVCPSMAFPMDFERLPHRPWPLSMKTVAVAAGLGHMGIHRNVIHPRFGNFILVGAVLTEATVSEYATQLEWNPCLGCKLCVAVCPVGAIRPDAEFDWLACYTHNYREHVTGFREWIGQIANSSDAADHQVRLTETEVVSMAQNLAAKPINYKSGYCVSVCPAGEDVIGPFLNDRKEHLRDVVNPLKERSERVYVNPGSTAEAHVRKRFPHKEVQYVNSGPRPAEPADPAPYQDDVDAARKNDGPDTGPLLVGGAGRITRDTPSRRGETTMAAEIIEPIAPTPYLEIHDDPNSAARIMLQTLRYEEGRQVTSVERTLAPQTGRFPAHVHRNMDQRFTISSGEATCRIGRERRNLRAGDVLDIPRGTVHVDPYNISDEPLTYVLRVTPVHLSDLIYLRSIGYALRQQRTNGQHELKVLELMAVMHATGVESHLAGIPVWLQRLVAIPLLGRIGRWRGYRPAPW